MIIRKEIKDKNGYTLPVNYERASITEVGTILKGKPRAHNGDYKCYCFLDPKADPQKLHTGSWTSVSSAQKLQQEIDCGIVDFKRLDAIRRMSKKYGTQNRKAREKFDVCGDEVDVYRVCQGEPEYMKDTVYKMKKVNILNLMLDVTVCCDISAEQLNEAGALMARVVKTVEKSGYKTNLTGMCGMTCYPSFEGEKKSRKEEVFCLLADIKKAQNPINYPRLMFAMSSQFFRGVGFNWFVHSVPQVKGGNWTHLRAHFDFNGMLALTRLMMGQNSTLIQADEIVRQKMKMNDDDKVVDWLINDVRTKFGIDI